jgi:hypothetical protein
MRTIPQKARSANPPDGFDERAGKMAEQWSERWRAEVVLLAAIAPAPRYRWNGVAHRAGVTLADFSWQDTYAIALAIHLASPERDSRVLCCKLAMLLLSEHNVTWDASDTRPFPAGTQWNFYNLARLFTSTLYRLDEPEMIAAALARVRALPALPCFDRRAA